MKRQYRKKPVVIDAEQWRPGAEIDGVRELSEPVFYQDRDGTKRAALAEIPTMEGQGYVCDFDWIITGVQGEIYPCKPDIFEQTYEAVD